MNYMRTRSIYAVIICWIDVGEDFRFTIQEEEPRGLRRLVADELEAGNPEAASTDTEGVCEAQVAARLGTARERRRRGNCHSTGSLRRCSPSVAK